jgi:hypothetical protein
MSALVLTSYFRPLASKTYWLESKRVCGWLLILVTVTCRIVYLPCAVSPKPSAVSPTDLACETDVMVNWNFPSRTGVPILATCGAAGTAFAGAAPLPAAGVPLLPPFVATEMMTIKTMNPARPRNVLRTQCRFFFGDCCGG